MSLHQQIGLCSLVAVLLSVAVALGPLEGIPHITDEIAYTLQSRLLAVGLRVGPPGDDAALMGFPFWVVQPHTYSPFPVGWPMLLALGERLGVAWLVNPLLAGLLPPLCWLLAREWVAPPVARLSAVIMALSPGVWILAASRMSHTSVLVALLLAAVVIVRGRDGRMAWAGAGLALAYVTLARPFDGVLLGGALLGLALFRAPSRSAWGLLAGLAGLGVAGTLADNLLLTGDPLRFAMSDYLDAIARPGCNRLGFGPDVGCHATLGSLGHTPAKALRLAGNSALRLDRLLLGVPGALLLVAAGAWRLRRWEPLAIIGLVVVGYGLYWSPGQALGARFWHPAYPALAILLAAGLYPLTRGLSPLAVLATTLAGGIAVVSDLSDRLWCVDGRLVAALEASGFNEGVVFIQGSGSREMHWSSLSIDDFRCTALLESGDGFMAQDPLGGGLEFRHALPDAESTRNYLVRHHPGSPAILVTHDIAVDERTLIPIPPQHPPEP
ncbi:MAG: hypothetical protein ACI8RZ_006174 [Myxococcota bacterium]|jgi:hypothetical protein